VLLYSRGGFYSFSYIHIRIEDQCCLFGKKECGRRGRLYPVGVGVDATAFLCIRRTFFVHFMIRICGAGLADNEEDSQDFWTGFTACEG